MAGVHKNIQLMLEFLKTPFLVLHFSCYTLMTSLMMLSVISLSMLIILLFVVSLIRHLICSNNLNWLLNLNLIYETLWAGARGGLSISMLGKLNWFCLTMLVRLVLLMLKWMSVLEENEMLGLTFSSKLDWILTLSLLPKLPLRKLEP